MRWVAIGALLCACGIDPIDGEGQFGAAIPLATGDGSLLPRLAFIDEGCPGAVAAGGCPASGDRACRQILIDSLAPLTAIRDDSLAIGDEFVEQECLELREAGGLAAEDPTAEDLENAVARFRFDTLPLMRSATPQDTWTWTAGDETIAIEPGGVLGGNLLRQFALSIRAARGSDPLLRVYTEFPGDEDDLADAGRAYIALQFPGRLLGRRPEDRCRVDDDRCEIPGYDLRPGQSNHALESTRMVLDACVSAPPCVLRYTRDPADPFAAGTCELTQGLELDTACEDASQPVVGGQPASLVVATSVQGVVLFDDSATRMFGDLAALATCDAIPDDALATTRACRLGDDDGMLRLPGWPQPELAEGLMRIAVRSLALVPGVVTPRDVGPCERVDRRRLGQFFQCDCWAREAASTGDVRDTSPPFSGSCASEVDDDLPGDLSASSLVVLGETGLAPPVLNEEPVREPEPRPDPARWLAVHVLPATHPLPLTIRRDVEPEAIQPDGLIGTAMFDDTETILDYTDDNPGLRVRCLDPRAGMCHSMPECRDDGQAACCFGLPLPLLVDYIVFAGDEVCCGALSASELEEVQELGHCQGSRPP